MKELESPICEAVRRLVEDEDGFDNVVTDPETPWFNPPEPIVGDEPLSLDVSEIAETLRRSGLV